VVEILPFRGARVRRPGNTELLEAYAVRSTLEALGARLAVPALTDADIAELAGYCDEMQRAAAAADRHAVAIADASFHGKLIEVSRNVTLERVWRSLEPFSRTYITLVAPGADATWTANLHGPILDAVQRRDPELVVRALQRHFDEVREHLGQGLSEPEAVPPPRAAAAS
jgi:DNA-binding GntR family transcriptional regulator